MSRYNRKQAREEKLRQSEEKYRLLIENILEGVFVIQDAKMQFVNEAFANITGYMIEEIIGMDFRTLLRQRIWKWSRIAIL